MNSEYNIKNRQDQFYTVQEFMWRDLKLDITECAIYSIILGYKAYICNVGASTPDPTSLSAITGRKSKCIRDRLSSMVRAGVLASRTVVLAPEQKRNVYVACYDINGKKSDEEIEALLNQGEQSVINFYYKTGPYKRGTKNLF